MGRNIGMKLIVAGTIIGYSNVSAFPISYTSAEEISITESTTVLQSLKIEEFQLNQEFSPDVKAYTASVGNDIEKMNLVVEKKEESASITINGETIESGEKTNLSLTTGKNTFTIIVTNGTVVSSYKITVVRAENDNNLLSSLSLSSGSLAFDPETSSYNLEVKNEISKMTIKPKVAVDTSTVQVNNRILKNEEGHSVELPVGSTTIKIIVTAENGSKRTYTVAVVRKEKEEDGQARDSNDEAKEQLSEEVLPANETSSGSGKLNATTETTGLNTNGTRSFTNVESLSVASDNGTNSTKNLDSLSTMTSTSETRTTANLASLTASNGTWNKTFSSDEYTYHLALEDDVTSLTITAGAEESDAKIFIDDKEISGSTTVTIDDKAKTVISVVVENGDDRKTYVVVFDKDIDEVATMVTAETNVSDIEETKVSTENASSKKATKEPNQLIVHSETQAETPSIWQKFLAFFGL